MKLAKLKIFLLLAALALASPLWAGRSFNGTTDVITANGIGSALDISGGNLTVSFWWRPSSVSPSTQAAVAHFSNGVEGSQFWVGLGVPSGIGAANQFGWGIGCCGALDGESYGTCGSASVTPDQWYQVVLYSIAGSETGMTVNGGSFCNAFTGWDGATIAAGQQNFTIGNQTGTSYPATGIIAEIAVWNTTLTSTERATLAQICPVGPSAKRMSFPPPAGYFPLYGASGASIEPDLSGHKDNGALTGTSRANHPPCTP
jgi:hypothetical protein